MPGWGDAGGVDDAGDVAERGGGLDEGVDRVAGGDVDGGRADVEAGVAQDFGGGVGVVLAQVGQDDVLAGADAPGDGLADRPGPMTTTTSLMMCSRWSCRGGW